MTGCVSCARSQLDLPRLDAKSGYWLDLISTNDTCLGADFGFRVALRPVVFAWEEFTLLKGGLRAVVFLVGRDDCDVVAVLDTARVVRAGMDPLRFCPSGGGSGVQFTRSGPVDLH